MISVFYLYLLYVFLFHNMYYCNISWSWQVWSSGSESGTRDRHLYPFYCILSLSLSLLLNLLNYILINALLWTILAYFVALYNSLFMSWQDIYLLEILVFLIIITNIYYTKYCNWYSYYICFSTTYEHYFIHIMYTERYTIWQFIYAYVLLHWC